jgi:hypothetical protein
MATSFCHLEKTCHASFVWKVMQMVLQVKTESLRNCCLAFGLPRQHFQVGYQYLHWNEEGQDRETTSESLCEPAKSKAESRT